MDTKRNVFLRRLCNWELNLIEGITEGAVESRENGGEDTVFLGEYVTVCLDKLIKVDFWVDIKRNVFLRRLYNWELNLIRIIGDGAATSRENGDEGTVFCEPG